MTDETIADENKTVKNKTDGNKTGETKVGEAKTDETATDAKVDSEKDGDVVQSQFLAGFIKYKEKKGECYAVYCKSSYDKKGKEHLEHTELGKVIDKERGLFYSLWRRGYFTFNLKDGYGLPNSEDLARYVYPRIVSLTFGDVWVFDQMLMQSGLDEIVEELIPKTIDTVKYLAAYRMFERHSFEIAENKYFHSYARILYPKAKLSERMIDKYLLELGNQEVITNFFTSYWSMLKKKRKLSSKTSFPILIDSTGPIKDIHQFVTEFTPPSAITIMGTMRLIHVVDKNNKAPLFFRYMPENVVDDTAIIDTINMLLTHNIKIKLAILDEGYNSLNNLLELISIGTPFIAKIPRNRKEYTELISNYGQDLECEKNAIVDDEKSLYWKKLQIKLNNHQLYAFIIQDVYQRAYETSYIMNVFLDYPDAKDIINEKLKFMGKFILLSSNDYNIKDLLSLYYDRKSIEHAFHLTANFGRLVPLIAHSNNAINGRLLISFISNIIYAITDQKLRKHHMDIDMDLDCMNYLRLTCYEDIALLDKFSKSQQEVFDNLKLECPYDQQKHNPYEAFDKLKLESHDQEKQNPYNDE
ncbi:MAG: transposase [Deltaproteobacteria bacterium]|jgi:hypothetical protein|nr:transposase [Deltaproteobacteria bacterium]